MRKTNNIFVVQWSFEKICFFQLPVNKVSFIMLILSKFLILKTNLRLIFSKIFEFMFHTFCFCVLRNKFFRLLRPSKTKVQAKKPQILNFGFLTFKTRRWGDFSKNIALYLTVPLCCSKIALSQDLGVVYYCFLLKWVDEYGNEKRQKCCDIWVHLSTAVELHKVIL